VGFEAESFGNWIYFRNQVLTLLQFSWPLRTRMRLAPLKKPIEYESFKPWISKPFLLRRATPIIVNWFAAAMEKITIGIPNHLSYCVVFVVYIRNL